MEHNPLAKQFTISTLLRFALPNMIMMVFMSLYTIVDGMFISRFVGEVALSATNMFYPVTSFQIGITIMLGTGASAIIAMKMGKGEIQEAKEDFTCITLVSLVIGILVSALGLIFLTPILNLLGTSAAQMEDCRTYAKILLWFAPMLFLQIHFQVLFVTAGKPNLGLIWTVLGGVANIVLDYLLMGPLDMGVAGAAVATGIGYCLPVVAGLVYFGMIRSGTLCFTKFQFRPKMLLRTCANGSSEMVSNVATAVTTFLFNIIFMKFWAEEGVAAITILSYFQFVFSAIFMGFSMGIAPVVSYKHGAGDERQLKQIFRIGIGFVAVCSVAVYVISRLTIGFSLSIFTDPGSPVYNLAMGGFAIYALQFLVMGISIFSSGLFTAFNNGMVSAIISMSRTFVFLVGSLLILPTVWGEHGVWFAVPVAELLGVMVSAGFLIWGRKEYQY